MRNDLLSDFAVVGTQLTAAIPITGLKSPRLMKYMI